MDLTKLSFDLDTLSQGYRQGAFSPSDVVLESLRRIQADDPNIWIAVDSQESLLAQAAALESQSPDRLPLYGLPFAVKDNIDVASLPTTAACPDFKRFARNDATTIARLRQAGAIPMGKTNLDQFATGLVGTRSPYGAPRNPFDPASIPGGSSSGSAIALATGQVAFSLGTDTAGSGRVPACFNNLVGLKPSRGLLSNHGLAPACKSLDCISIFALNCGDAQRVFQASAAFDSKDPYSRPWPRNLDTAARLPKRNPTFGVPEPSQLQFFGHSAYRELYLESIGALEDLGWTRRVIDIQPLLEAARLLYQGPWVAERYWAIKDLMENAPQALHPITRSIIEGGAKPSAVDAFDAFYRLQSLAQATRSLWDQIDFLTAPTAGRPYSLEEVAADPIATNSNLGRYTNFVNLLDLCAVATPTGFTEEGMPFGISLIAPAFHDQALLAYADRLHRQANLPLGASSHRHYSSLSPVAYDSLPIAVCGAHLSGLPLNHQLTDLGAVLQTRTATAPSYRLFALPDSQPPKPGLLRDDSGAGRSIEVETWLLPKSQWAAFIEQVPSPLAIGSIELADGSMAKGFLCEAWATQQAQEITHLASWRAYLKKSSPPTA